VEEAEARDLFAAARVVRLATVAADGRPHQVPVCFALDRSTLFTAVDHKPKRTLALRRLANVAANPAVSLLADHYEEEWSQLWWVRADGAARIAEPGSAEHDRAVELLVARYEQYQEHPPEGPALVVEVSRWTGWRASDQGLSGGG
jgi:PPOX class probable F420-dependent enzyme